MPDQKGSSIEGDGPSYSQSYSGSYDDSFSRSGSYSSDEGYDTELAGSASPDKKPSPPPVAPAPAPAPATGFFGFIQGAFNNLVPGAAKPEVVQPAASSMSHMDSLHSDMSYTNSYSSSDDDDEGLSLQDTIAEQAEAEAAKTPKTEEELAAERASIFETLTNSTEGVQDRYSPIKKKTSTNAEGGVDSESLELGSEPASTLESRLGINESNSMELDLDATLDNAVDNLRSLDSEVDLDSVDDTVISDIGHQETLDTDVDLDSTMDTIDTVESEEPEPQRLDSTDYSRDEEEDNGVDDDNEALDDAHVEAKVSSYDGGADSGLVINDEPDINEAESGSVGGVSVKLHTATSGGESNQDDEQEHGIEIAIDKSIDPSPPEESNEKQEFADLRQDDSGLAFSIPSEDLADSIEEDEHDSSKAVDEADVVEEYSVEANEDEDLNEAHDTKLDEIMQETDDDDFDFGTKAKVEPDSLSTKSTNDEVSAKSERDALIEILKAASRERARARALSENRVVEKDESEINDTVEDAQDTENADHEVNDDLSLIEESEARLLQFNENQDETTDVKDNDEDNDHVQVHVLDPEESRTSEGLEEETGPVNEIKNDDVTPTEVAGGITENGDQLTVTASVDEKSVESGVVDDLASPQSDTDDRSVDAEEKNSMEDGDAENMEDVGKNIDLHGVDLHEDVEGNVDEDIEKEIEEDIEKEIEEGIEKDIEEEIEEDIEEEIEDDMEEDIEKEIEEEIEKEIEEDIKEDVEEDTQEGAQEDIEEGAQEDAQEDIKEDIQGNIERIEDEVEDEEKVKEMEKTFSINKKDKVHQIEEDVAQKVSKVISGVLVSDDEHENTARLLSNEKVQQMFNNFTTFDEASQAIIKGSVQIDDEVKRHRSTLISKSTKSAWWENSHSNQRNDVSEEESALLKKGAWFYEQLEQADLILNSSNGNPVQKKIEDKIDTVYRADTKIWWDPMGRTRKRPAKNPKSARTRRWFFDAHEQENDIGMRSLAVTSERNTQFFKSQKRKITSISGRSWVVESDKDEEDVPLETLVNSTEEKEPSQNEKENKKLLEPIDPDAASLTSIDVNSVESTITDLKRKISSSIRAIDVGRSASENSVTFKNPAPMATPREPLQNGDEILKKHTKRRKALNFQVVQPSPQIKDLILGLESESISRRSNACGTLKLMASQKKNTSVMGKTAGLVDALLTISKHTPHDKDSDSEAILTCRNRALTTIALLCQPKDNRRGLCEHKDLINHLSDAISNSGGEARLHSCSSIAALAKTEENRDILAETDGLMEKLAQILSDLREKPKTSEAEESKEGSEVQPKSSSSQKISSSTRLNSCAALLHLSKQCGVSVKMCNNEIILRNLALNCQDVDDPVHSRCMEALAHLTRFPDNNDVLLQCEEVQEALYKCGTSLSSTDRTWALRALQNITAHSSKKGWIADDKMLQMICLSTEQLDFVEEHEIAISILGNLSTDPLAVVQMTNTENVMKTLVKVAHDNYYDPEIQFVACDALATIAMWIQRVARAGSVPEGYSFEKLPTLRSQGYMRYNTNE